MKSGSVRQRVPLRFVGLAVGAIAATGSSWAIAQENPDASAEAEKASAAAAPDAGGTPESRSNTAEETRVSRARDAAIAGLDAFDQGRYAEAEQKLVEAYALVKVPTLALYLARVYARQGKWVEALRYFDEAQALVVDRGDEATQAQAQADAQHEAEALRERVPRVRVRLEGATREPIEASVDGQSVRWELLEQGYLVNPGWRQIEVRQGDRVVHEQVQAEVGREQELVLRLEAPSAERPVEPTALDQSRSVPAEPESDWRPLGWVSVGIGAAGIGLGTAAGVWALTLRSKLEDECPDKACPPAYHDDVDNYRRLRTVSTASFIVGGIGVAAGVTLLLQQSTASKSSSQLRVNVSWNQAVVTGSF